MNGIGKGLASVAVCALFAYGLRKGHGKEILPWAGVIIVLVWFFG
jgi:hypothetical protein